MAGISKARRPRTPVRRLSQLLNIFSRPSNNPRTASRFIPAVRSTNHTGEVSIAIQNEDAAEDAIVVTSLDKIPFCCHADLLLMNREQLLVAASVLNERLPVTLQIDTDRSDFYIRNSIEFVVGLRNNQPDTPTKPTTPSRHFVPSSPISPLAKRSRSQYSQLVASPSPLCDVTEEEEPEGQPIVIPHQDRKGPPLKRRKLVQGPVSPTPPRVQPRPRTLRSLGSTPTGRITRSQSTQITRPQQPPPGRVPRSHSQKMNLRSPTAVTAYPSLVFRTPKRTVRGPHVQPSSGSILTSPPCPLTESPASDTPSSARRRECRRDSSVEREVEVVMGLQNMNIPSVGSED